MMFGIIIPGDYPGYDTLGSGKPFLVLGTVVRAISEFITQAHPYRIEFTGEGKRGPIYRAIGNKVKNRFPGYVFIQGETNRRYGRANANFELLRRD